MENIETNWFVNDSRFFEKALSTDSLKRAWFALKSKQGVSIEGASKITLSSISEAWFYKSSKKLINGSFQYPNRKKLLIDKQNSGSIQLTVVDSEIKVIERALLNALEPFWEGYSLWKNVTKKKYLSEILKNKDNSYYKTKVIGNESVFFKKKVICAPVFHAHNYGSRPQKSAHQALKSIKHWRTTTSFLIYYGTSQAFGTVSCKRLKKLFTKKIKDQRFWSEISKIKSFRGFIDPLFFFEKTGVTPGGTLSSFLFNIYMDSLDDRVVSLQKLVNKINKSHKSTFCSHKKAGIRRHRISCNFTQDTPKEYCSKKVTTNAKKFFDKEYRAKYGCQKDVGSEVTYLQYVRYVSDFIVGITGNRKFALQIQKYLCNFIKRNLHLEVKKNNLVSCNNRPLKFLGHLIGFKAYKDKTSTISKSIRAAVRNKNKSIFRFLESDLFLAKSKSHQFYSSVLKQFGILSSKLKTSICNKSQMEVLASIIAYKSLGSQLLKNLNLDTWEQFNELLSSVDSCRLNSEKKNNPALSRWSSYLQTESDRLSELSAKILYDRIARLTASRWSRSLSKGRASKIKDLQKGCLIKVEEIIKESLNARVEKRCNKIIYDFKRNKNPKTSHSKPEKNLLDSAKKHTDFGLKKLSPKRFSINAPIVEVFSKLRLSGFIHPTKNKSMGNSRLGFSTDSEIVSYFNSIIRGLLNSYSGVDNFAKVKGLAQLLRSSCILTLASKHKKSKNWVYTVYGSEITVLNGKKKTKLISRSCILNYFNAFNLRADSSLIDPYYLDNVILFK